MSTITKRDFGNYITVKGGFEVQELGKAFNYMLDELNDYIRQLLDTQKEQQRRAGSIAAPNQSAFSVQYAGID